MKTKELMDLGISKETAKKIQAMHGKDRQRLLEKVANMEEPERAEQLRALIRAQVQLITGIKGLLEIRACCDGVLDGEIKSRKEKVMAYYRTCEHCGASLDPGEKCDCQKETAAEPATTNPDNSAAAKSLRQTKD